MLSQENIKKALNIALENGLNTTLDLFVKLSEKNQRKLISTIETVNECFDLVKEKKEVII